jgi:hypothetical protein
VKKACIYLLLPFILFNGSLVELCKLPAFFSHFLSHHQKQNVNLLEFISMHYLGNDINDNDDAEDMKLPFKKANNNAFVQFNIPLAKPINVGKQHYRSIETPKLIPYNYLITDPSLDALFRPPRKANS